MVDEVSKYIKSNPNKKMDSIYKLLSCINDDNEINKLNSDMKRNENRINRKCIYLEIGLIINIIGVILIIAFVILR